MRGFLLQQDLDIMDLMVHSVCAWFVWTKLFLVLYFPPNLFNLSNLKILRPFKCCGELSLSKSKRFKKALEESCQDPVVYRNLNFCAHSARPCVALYQFYIELKTKKCWRRPVMFCCYTFCSIQAKIQMLTPFFRILPIFHQ